MKAFLTIILGICACVSFGQQTPSPDPVPFTSFQDNLWDDLWSDVFVEDFDFLLSADSMNDSQHTLHRLEWDDAASHLDGDKNAAVIDDFNYYDMNWFEEGTESVEYSLANGLDWSADVTVSTYSFSGTISSGNGYMPHIYSVMRHVVISDNFGNTNEYNCFMPLGRGVTLSDADYAAFELAEEILPGPSLIDTAEDCATIYNNRRQTAGDDYQDDIDGCRGILNRLRGAGLGAAGGATVGAGIGSIVPVVGTGTVAGVLAVAGGVGGFFYSNAHCVDDAKRDYRKRYRRDWDCYQECLLTGSWNCG